MIFYDIQNERTIYERIHPKDVIEGSRYSIADIISKEKYENDEKSYFVECHVPSKATKLMCDEYGRKPFAIATHDSPNDDIFKYFELSKILVRQGYHFIYNFKEEKNGLSTILIFRLDELFNTQDVTRDIVNTTLIHKLTSTDTIPSKFNEVVQHSIKIFNSYQEDYLLPKYCFNPGRIITIRLFQKGSGDDLISYLNEDKQLIVNTKSPLYFKKGQRVINNNIIARCFYSKKFKDTKYTLVDGYPLDLLKERDLDDYIEKSCISKEMSKLLIKKAYTKYEESFYIILNNKQEIRPLYKTASGYSSFALNEFENKFIIRLEDAIQ